MFPRLIPRDAMEIWVLLWGSQRGKGVERKIFCYGSFTLISFLSTSWLCSLKLSVLLHGEHVCRSSGQEESVRVAGWGAGKHCCSHLCGQEPRKPTWVGETVMWLICKEKERVEGGRRRRAVLKCFSSCGKKKAKVAVRIPSPCVTDVKTKVKEKARCLWRPFD